MNLKIYYQIMIKISYNNYYYTKFLLLKLKTSKDSFQVKNIFFICKPFLTL